MRSRPLFALIPEVLANGLNGPINSGGVTRGNHGRCLQPLLPHEVDKGSVSRAVPRDH